MSKTKTILRKRATCATIKTSETTFEGFDGKATKHISAEKAQSSITDYDLLDALGELFSFISPKEFADAIDEGIFSFSKYKSFEDLKTVADLYEHLRICRALILEVRKQKFEALNGLK